MRQRLAIPADVNSMPASREALVGTAATAKSAVVRHRQSLSPAPTASAPREKSVSLVPVKGLGATFEQPPAWQAERKEAIVRSSIALAACSQPPVREPRSRWAESAPDS